MEAHGGRFRVHLCGSARKILSVLLLLLLQAAGAWWPVGRGITVHSATGVYGKVWQEKVCLCVTHSNSESWFDARHQNKCVLFSSFFISSCLTSVFTILARCICWYLNFKSILGTLKQYIQTSKNPKRLSWSSVINVSPIMPSGFVTSSSSRSSSRLCVWIMPCQQRMSHST